MSATRVANRDDLADAVVELTSAKILSQPRENLRRSGWRAHRPPSGSRLLLILIGILSMFTSSCGCVPDWVHGDGSLYGIHNEDLSRANVVIYRMPTEFLIGQLNSQGIRAVRSTLLQAAPGGGITLWCYPGGPCVRTADVRDDFRDDIRNRSDLDDALRDAARNRDCLAWTFLPSRNFTHKKHSCKGL